MTIAIGTDIVEIERIAQSLSRQGDRLVKRILMPSELVRFKSIENTNIKTAFLAKRWCAKEAVAKALGTGIAKGVGFQQIEIINDDLGAPLVILHDGALSRLNTLGAQKALISISDEQHYALAFCTIV